MSRLRGSQTGSAVSAHQSRVEAVAAVSYPATGQLANLAGDPFGGAGDLKRESGDQGIGGQIVRRPEAHRDRSDRLPDPPERTAGNIKHLWLCRLMTATGGRMDKRTVILRAIALEEWVSQFLLVAIVVLVFVAALTRYIGMPINWSVDVAQALFVWVIFLGANQAWRHSRHIGIDLLVQRCNARTRLWIHAFLYGSIAVFLVSLIVSGIHITIVNAGRILQDIPISYSYVTMAVPVGSFLMLLTTGKKILLLFESKPGRGQAC